MPAHNRNQTAQFVQIQNCHLLIDCGEGTQMQLRHYGLRMSRIDYIFISHLHGDHCLGLMGLISTLNLYGRTNPLHLYGPRGLDEIITVQLRHSQTWLRFPLQFHIVDTSKARVILDHEHFTVESIPLIHRVPCAGYLFREKPKPLNINKAALHDKLKLQEIALFKQGKDVCHEDGSIKYRHEDYTLPAKRSRSYAYCSDTQVNPAMIEQIRGVELLYHEATFTSDLAARASHTMHSTAQQAAETAKEAAVEHLLIGHFSTRYKELDGLLDEAKEVFEDTELAIEGVCVSIPE